MQKTHAKDLNPKCAVSDCYDAIFNILEEDFSDAVIINCYFHMCENVKNNHTKHLKNKELKHATLEDINNFQRISCIEDVEKGYELIKEKFPEEANYFNQFEEPCWKGFRKNCISTYLDYGVLRTNNSCERHNRHGKDNFIFRKLSKPSEFLQNKKMGQTWKLLSFNSLHNVTDGARATHKKGYSHH